MNSVKVVGIVAIIVFCFIYFITNKKLKTEILNILNFKIYKIKVKDIFVILIFLIIILYSFILIFKSKQNIDFFMAKEEAQENGYIFGKEMCNKQNKEYKELMKMETNIENCKNPYIPEEFKYVEGNWNDGFVIEDNVGNQFVWVPCTNIENNDGIPLLEKVVFKGSEAIYFNCYEDDDYKEFIISSLENGGFYISRFEIGNENDVPVSKSDMEIWTNVTYKEAKELSENMYKNINSRLINGYAVDTAISFIFNEINVKDIPQTKYITGNQEYKKIYDLVDNLNEWTTECRYKSNLYRGTYFESPNNKIMRFADRFASFDKLENLGFRTIIYK